MECDFCLRLDPGHIRTSRYDFAVLEASEHFQVVVALGAIAPGHILIVTTEHVPSMAALPEAARRELVTVSQRWHQRLAQIFVGEIVLFEHGSLSDEMTGGSCIVHAHWQLVPLPEGLATPPPAFRPQSQRDISQLAGRDYLLMKNSVGMYVSPEGWNAPSPQFWRRRLLDCLGRPQEWDYLAYPNIKDMETTLNALASLETGPPALGGLRGDDIVDH